MEQQLLLLEMMLVASWLGEPNGINPCCALLLQKPSHVEMWGAVAGWDIQHVVVETDSQNLVNLLNTMDGHSAAISAGSDGNPRA